MNANYKVDGSGVLTVAQHVVVGDVIRCVYAEKLRIGKVVQAAPTFLRVEGMAGEFRCFSHDKISVQFRNGFVEVIPQA